MKSIYTRAFSGIVLAAAITPVGAAITLNPISSARNGEAVDVFDKSAAEIVKFDPATQRMFVVNGADDAVDIFDVSDLLNPTLLISVDLSEFGNPNSVDVHPSPRFNEVAVAVGAADKTQRGRVVFLNKDGEMKGSVEVGFLPDMLTYDGAGRRLVVANEGEPNDDYTVDPEGSVSIIEIFGRSGRRRITEVGFGGLSAEDLEGVRLSGPEGTTPAQDIEPEYVAIDARGRYAYVSCQENNAVAVIDLWRKRVERMIGLGSINHAELGNALDVSDRDDLIRIANWPVKGLPMPDAIAVYEVSANSRGRGRGASSTYIVTANEGDGREYGDYEDEVRVKDLELDPSAFPLGDILKEDANLGRLAVISTEGDADGDGVYQELYSFGTRSFSIYSSEGELVFDSGEMIEAWIAENLPEGFNSTNSENQSVDSRSDAKGPEPEAIEIGQLGDKTYAFVGLERVSAIMVFDITDPRQVSFVTFAANRDFSVVFDEDDFSDVASAGDLGPEGLDFVAAKDSPNGKPLLIVANEVSGTTTVYEISE
ncbi:choice-of-anchor I family protein [Haloferula sp.]|uniref:choice-of-anchor I family protein n=1 Tax=Haloferula sp. TaxID=2497595 RepID=UPI003C72F71C